MQNSQNHFFQGLGRGSGIAFTETRLETHLVSFFAFGDRLPTPGEGVAEKTAAKRGLWSEGKAFPPFDYVLESIS